MNKGKLLTACIGTTVVLVVLYLTFNFVFIDFFVDLWWFQSLEFEAYFWLKLLYRFIFSGIVTAFFFIVFLSHFWIASRYLGLNTKEDIANVDNSNHRFQVVADVFITRSAKIYTPLSLLLAVIIAIPFYVNWEQALLFFFGSAAGKLDTLYGNDVSFYMFQYPIYLLIQKQLLVSAILVFMATSLLYWMEHNLVPNQSKAYPVGAKIHLCFLFVFVAAFIVWGFILQRYGLLFSDANEPIFFGPGFVELRYQLPLIWLAIFAVFAFSLAVIFNVFAVQHKTKIPALVALVILVIAFALQHIHLIPEIIETFLVKPNYSRIEAETMRENIDATLSAYNLDNIKVIDFPVKLNATQDIDEWSSIKHFENIPVWDREILIDSYMQLQGIRPYYGFPTVDEDRYFINGHHQQVNLAAREINIEKLPLEAHNWENTYLRYTHGYGAVITPAAQDAGNPILWYLRDLNLTSDVGFTVKHPDIYYGEGEYVYAVVPNKLPVEAISGTTADVQDYLGNSGIPINSYLRKLLLSTYLHDEKVFLSPNITEDSKLLLHRNIQERITKITPFLHLDKDPYLVVAKDRFYWVQDAYTLSNFYPFSKPSAENSIAGHKQFNYIRNSVKIIVDAYDGKVDYYISDSSDPIIKAYNRAYPGLFKKLTELSDELMQHLRYPRDLYYLQMKIYAKYHQNSPELYYEQAETWQFASLNGKDLLPYFITMDFNHCNDEEEFVMINPMTPINRDNLSMVGIAGTLDDLSCDHTYKPAITVFKFPKAIQVNGPSQVNALIDQNPEIAAQFTLWNQQGAKVKKGRMIILPMGNSILYVQPIYMLATQTKIPELTRVIVSIGNQVVMEKNLQTAFERLKKLFIKNENTSNSGITGLGGK